MTDLDNFHFQDPHAEIVVSAENEARIILGIPLIGDVPNEMQEQFNGKVNELLEDSEFNPYTKRNQRNVSKD